MKSAVAGLNAPFPADDPGISNAQFHSRYLQQGLDGGQNGITIRESDHDLRSCRLLNPWQHLDFQHRRSSPITPKSSWLHSNRRIRVSRMKYSTNSYRHSWPQDANTRRCTYPLSHLKLLCRTLLPSRVYKPKGVIEGVEDETYTATRMVSLCNHLSLLC